MLLWIPLALFALLTAAIATFGYFQLSKSGQVARRLREGVGAPGTEIEEAPRFAAAADLLGKIGSAVPISPSDTRVRRKSLVAAGYRQPSAVAVFYGLKIVSAAGLLVLDAVFRNRIFPHNDTLSLISLFAATAVGYVLPGVVLDGLVSRRNTRLRQALPDMLDLLTVSTEAGSALDQAMMHVARELKAIHPDLAEEISIVNFEMLAGKSRAEALRDMGIRNREPELRKLMAVLIQTDRFGTSIADALRSQSDFLRVRRRQMAQERAGKLGVRIIFPIFFFCFPALLILVAGPGLLALFKNLFPIIQHVH
jgi:tight adherence protein C